MTFDLASTDPCSRNRDDACPILHAGVPPNDPYYTSNNNGYCKACNQIYLQLKKRGIDIHRRVGRVSRPVFNRGMARVRALQYQAHSPSNDDRFYIPLVNEVIDFAQEAKVNDVSFETEIERILARYPPPTINTTQDDEEQEAEEQGGEQGAEYQDDARSSDEEQEAEEQGGEQGAEYQDDAQSSDEEGAVPDTLQDVLKEMREISARQARYASRMIVLIAAMEHLSVA